MNYKETRFCENLNITQFDTEGEYNIPVYDKNNKSIKTIDLEEEHQGIIPHVHHGYNHNEFDSIKGATNLTLKEKNS